MKAVVFHNPGLENLRIEEIPNPKPGPGEVLIRVKYVGVNPLDYAVVSGSTKASPMPHVPGSEFAGVVEEVGAGVAGITPGAPVTVYNRLFCGSCRHCLTGWTQLCETGGIIGVSTQGGMAEYAVVPAKNVERVNADLKDAATLPIGALTAYNMTLRASISPGEKVAVVGASGNVGTYAVQFAKMVGGEVYAVTRRREVVATALSQLGVDVVTPEDARRLAPFDVVLDPTGAANWGLSTSLLGRGGRYVTAGALTGSEVSLDLRRLYGQQISVIGSTGGRRADFKTVIRLLEAGRIRAVIHAIYPLSDVAKALAGLSSPGRVGKILLEI